MKTTKNILLTGALLCVATVVHSGPGMPGVTYSPAANVQNPAPPAMQEAGITCDRCQATWVLRADSASGRKLMAIRHAKVATCPHCKMAAARYLETGKLSSNPCKGCGGTLTEACPNLLPGSKSRPGVKP